MLTVLWLGEWMEQMPSCGCLIRTTEPLELGRVKRYFPDIIIANRYRHLIPTDICAHFDGRAFNIHASYLPWNRGTHPNFWSWYDNTPKGVTIHCLAPRLDRGDIVAQREVAFDCADTLRTSYERLERAANRLLLEKWDDLIDGTFTRTPQSAYEGSYHRAKDLKQRLLPHGWDTPVGQVLAAGLAARSKQ